MSINELRVVSGSEGVGNGSSRKLSALERGRESYRAFERRKGALAEQNAAFSRRLSASSESDAVHAQPDAQAESVERFADDDSAQFSDLDVVESFEQSEAGIRERKRERARERRERRTQRVESLYESLDTVHEKISDSETRERFLSVTNATSDPRETRARAVNMRYIATQFKQFKDTIESDATAYAGIRSAVAVRLFATEAEREAIENARDEGERATALRAFTDMTDVEFFERQSARIAQKTERENLSNSVLLAVRDAVLKERSIGNVDALEIYRAAKSELIDARASSSADAASNAVQFNAAELDELRRHSLVAAERAQRDRASINDTVEVLLYVFARDRKAGAVDGKFSEYADETKESAIERLAQHSDEERSLIYYTLGLRAEDAPETEKARGRGWAGKLSEKVRRSFRDIARSHIENLKQSDSQGRMQIAERLKRGERVTGSPIVFDFGEWGGRWEFGGENEHANVYYRGKERFASDDEKNRFIADTERDWRIYRAATEMEGVVDGTIDPTDFDNKWINALAEGPGQAAFMLEAAAPVIGLALVASTTKALRTKELVMRGVPLQQATTIATISAVPEALIERLQLNILIGKGAAGKLIGNLVTDPTAKRLGKRAAVTFGADMVMQTAQEQLQDAAPLAIQHIASWLDDKVPATTIEDWKELGASTPEVAVTMLIPVLLGTGAGTFRSRAFARQHMAAEQTWRAAGFKEEVVQQITELVRVDKLKEAQALVQSSWNDAAKRKAKAAEQIEASEELEATLRAGGEMLAEHNITIDDEGIFTVRDRNGDVVDTAATPEAAIELVRAVSEREREAWERADIEKKAEFGAWYEEELRKEEEARAAEVSGFESENSPRSVEEAVLEREKARLEQMRQQYPEEAAQAEAEPKKVSSSEFAEIKERRDRAIETLEKRARAVEVTGGSEKSVREYQVALKQAEKLDSEYALAWFYHQLGMVARLEAAMKRGETLQERMSNPFYAQQRTTLPDNSRKGSWDGRQEKQETASAQQEQQSQDASNNAEADVGPKTAQGLSKQAGEMLERTQNRGVLGMPMPTQYVGEGRGTVVLTPDAAQRRDALAAQEPVLIESSLSDNLSKEERKAKAKELYPLNQVFTNRATGRAIKMVKRAIGKLRDHSASLRSLKIMPHLKELVENAIPLFENTGEGKHWHHYGVAATIDGEAFIVRLVAYENVNGQLHMDVFYDAQTTPRKAMEGLTSLGQSAETNRDAQSRSPSRDIAVTWARAVKAKESQGNASTDTTAPVLGSPLRQGQPNAARVSYEGEAAEAGTALAKRKRPVSAWEVMKAIAKVVKPLGRSVKAMNRLGGVGRRAAGHFEPHSKVTRIKVANDIWAAAHELAHAIDDALFKRGHWLTNDMGLAPNQRGELYRLGKQLYKEYEPHNGYHSEGFAEFVRLWLTDQAQAKEKAPEFARWFEGELGLLPEFARAVATAQALAHRYLAQGSEERAKANLGRKEGELAKAWEWITENSLYWIEEKFIDSGAAVRRFARDAAKARGERQLPAELDPMLSLVGTRMTAAGVVDYMANHGMLDFARNRTGGVPLAEAYALVGKERVEDFHIYLWAKRTIALWNDPRGPRNSGLDIKDAEQIIREKESPEFIRAAQIFYDWHAGVLDYVAQASPAMAETVRKIREVDPGFYVPLQREFNELEKRYRATGGSSAARAELTKRLKGSGRGVKDFTASSLAQAHDLILKAHQRRVIDQIMHLSRTTEGLGHLIVEVPVEQVPVAHASLAEMLGKVEKAIGTDGALKQSLEALGQGDLLSEVTTFFAPANHPKKGENPTFAVWENGKTHWYEVDEQLYTALSGMDNEKMNIGWRLAGLPAKTLRLGTTGLRPSFSLVTNAVRDFSTLYINSRADANGGKLLMSWLGVQKDAFLYAVTNGKADNAYIDLARRLSLEMAQPLAQDSRPLDRAARRVKNGGKFDLMKGGDYYDFMLDVLQFTELGSRVTELKAIAKDMNWDPSMPMTPEMMLAFSRASKQVTTDFTQAGTWARKLNQIIPFFNAAIQGPVAHYRALRRAPAKFIMRGFMLSALTLANWFRNRDEEWWKEMPIAERYRFTYIPLPNGDLLRIPRAFESDGFFMAGAEALVDGWYAKDPKAVVEWFGEWLGSLLLPPMVPAFAKPALEIGFNKDFFREREIVPLSEQRRPDAEQYGPYTSKVAIKLGEMFDVSPRMVDHAVRGYFGGLGSDLVGLLGRGNSDLVQREWEASDMPIWGVLFQRGGQRASQPKSVSAMYDAYRKALDRQNSIRHEETPEEKQQRLMLTDAAKAVGLYRDISLITKSKEARLELEKAQIQIAREVMELVKAGEVDRSVSGRARGEAEAAQRQAMAEHYIQPNGKKSRPIRDAISR